MADLAFVNFMGQAVDLDPEKHAKKKIKKEQPESFHNGWRVQGIPPGALEGARKAHLADAQRIAQNGKQPKDWDEQHWLMNARRKAVRSKPYEVEQAAHECKALAEKAGWLRVEVVELKKEKGAT